MVYGGTILLYIKFWIETRITKVLVLLQHGRTRHRLGDPGLQKLYESFPVEIPLPLITKTQRPYWPFYGFQNGEQEMDIGRSRAGEKLIFFHK